MGLVAHSYLGTMRGLAVVRARGLTRPIGVLAVVLASASLLSATRQTSGLPLRSMLREAYELVKKRYYDPGFHGLDWDARYREFEAKIRGMTSVNAGLGAIAEFLDGLKDSHTYFLPPSRPFDHDYGYRLRIVGEKTFVSRVVERSDAAAKLKPGDEVISINGFVPARDTLITVQYILNALAPLESVELVVRSPARAVRKVLVNATITEKPKRLAEWEPWAIYRTKDEREPHRLVSIGDVLVWKMPAFEDEERQIDGLWGRARKHRALILDLRGNGGGFQTTLTRMLANAIDRDFKAFDTIERKGRSPVDVKSRRTDGFSGPVVVLVDSESASAAELFARVMQLEKRADVLGDRTAGFVMAGRFHEGESRHLLYGFVVTEGDVAMTDGQSLERVGVVPDETVLPTAEDLASGRDPTLAAAARRLGVDLDPEAAGRLYEKK